MQFPHLWIHLCRLHLFFSISKARSSHTFTESSTFWPLCHSSHPLTYIGIPWRAQKDSGQEWTSAVFVFHVLGTDFLSLFTVSLLGWLSACLFPAEITSVGDAEVAFLTTVEGMTAGDWYCFSYWREVTPADICFASANLFNAKLLPPSWFTSHTLILRVSNILFMLSRK